MGNKVVLLCEELCHDQMSSRGPAAAWDYEDSNTFFFTVIVRQKFRNWEKKLTSFSEENSGCVLSQYVHHLPDSSQHPVKHMGQFQAIGVLPGCYWSFPDITELRGLIDK